MSNSSGIFYIMSRTGTYLDLTDTSPETNVTTWHYTGTSAQQWNLTAYNGPSSVMYTVQNVYTSTYITYSTIDNPGVFVTQSLTPFYWYFQPYGNGFAVGLTDQFDLTWNDDNGYSTDNNPVILWACCDVWTLYTASNSSTASLAPTSATSISVASLTSLPTSTSSTSSSTSSSSSSTNIPLIVGLSVGLGVGVFVILGIVLWSCCCREGAQHHTLGVSSLVAKVRGKAAA